MGERNISVTLAYDGTDFSGWQIQRSQRTVQGVLEDVLKSMHGRRVPVTGAGRTDSGVHAHGQVANFVTDIASIPAEKYKEALNSNLPLDLRVIRSRVVDRDFDARRSARERIYKYYLYISSVGFPHYRRYCWRISRKPDIAYLNRIVTRSEEHTSELQSHSFISYAVFCLKKKKKKETKKTNTKKKTAFTKILKNE